MRAETIVTSVALFQLLALPIGCSSSGTRSSSGGTTAGTSGSGAGSSGGGSSGGVTGKHQHRVREQRDRGQWDRERDQRLPGPRDRVLRLESSCSDGFLVARKLGNLATCVSLQDQDCLLSISAAFQQPHSGQGGGLRPGLSRHLLRRPVREHPPERLYPRRWRASQWCDLRAPGPVPEHLLRDSGQRHGVRHLPAAARGGGLVRHHRLPAGARLRQVQRLLGAGWRWGQLRRSQSVFLRSGVRGAECHRGNAWRLPSRRGDGRRHLRPAGLDRPQLRGTPGASMQCPANDLCRDPAGRRRRTLRRDRRRPAALPRWGRPLHRQRADQLPWRR